MEWLRAPRIRAIRTAAPSDTDRMLGTISSIWRYPVKSMQGEELVEASLGERGIHGDRGFALRDREDGRVATAKNPRKWPALFRYSAALQNGGVAITLPDGTVLGAGAPDADGALSSSLGRAVTLEAAGAPGTCEAASPDDPSSPVSTFALPPGTFFDAAPLHILTTATLARLSAAYPAGRFERPRFRPNLVVEHGGDGFVENGWIGMRLAVGSARLEITAPAGRCIMTTLAQLDLPHDPGILKTIAKENGACLGVYARVLESGAVRRGDPVRLLM
jgi:uncharacterized protein YcbX